MGSAGVSVNDALSSISGGSLSASTEYVGKVGPGTFAQSGGTSSVSSNSGGLYLGYTTQANLTIASVIADNGGATGLSKAGSGTLTLTGSNTYSGVTTVGAGTLQVGAGGASGNPGTGPVTDNSAGDQALQPLDLQRGHQRRRQPDPGGAGTLTLTGSNTYSGGTAINAGALQLALVLRCPAAWPPRSMARWTSAPSMRVLVRDGHGDREP